MYLNSQRYRSSDTDIKPTLRSDGFVNLIPPTTPVNVGHCVYKLLMTSQPIAVRRSHQPVESCRESVLISYSAALTRSPFYSDGKQFVCLHGSPASITQVPNATQQDTFVVKLWPACLLASSLASFAELYEIRNYNNRFINKQFNGFVSSSRSFRYRHGTSITTTTTTTTITG